MLGADVFYEDWLGGLQHTPDVYFPEAKSGIWRVCHFHLEIDLRRGFATGFGVEYSEERTSSELGIFPNQL